LSPPDLLDAMPLSLGRQALAPLASLATTLRLMPTDLGSLFLSALPRAITLVTTSMDLALSARLSLPNSESALSASEPSTNLLMDRLEPHLLLLSPSPLPVSLLPSSPVLLFS
jgi:hypothetical protein